jgi:SAM-dependent methyltransferase
MPISTFGGTGEVVPSDVRISIYTPTHSTQYLRELYDSIKDQDFYEWLVIYNNGAAPIDFGDPRVKSHLLYKAPEKVGALKAFACEQATGDVLLELDHDDLLMPTAIEEVKAAFKDPTVGFVYSNAIHCFDGFKPYPRFDTAYGWGYREIEYKGHKLDEFISFAPSPEAVSRIWYAPDHLRAFRISDYRQAGGYDRTMRVLDDGDLMCRLYIQTKFKHIDKGLYIYRVHGQNSWLKYNKEIQDNVYKIYDKYIVNMVDKWAENNNLNKLEIGKVIPPRDGYNYISIEEANKSRWRIPDSSVGVIVAIDSLAMIQNPLQVMKEAARVLVPGGWLMCQVPSTDGRGAWQDPRHCSYWNENSFLYYTNKNWSQYIDTPVRFQAPRLYTTEKDQKQVCWTIAHLINLKEGYRPAGQLEI